MSKSLGPDPAATDQPKYMSELECKNRRLQCSGLKWLAPLKAGLLIMTAIAAIFFALWRNAEARTERMTTVEQNAAVAATEARSAAKRAEDLQASIDRVQEKIVNLLADMAAVKTQLGIKHAAAVPLGVAPIPLADN